MTAQVKTDCTLRHNRGGELILHFFLLAPAAANERRSACVLGGAGAATLTESIKAGLLHFMAELSPRVLPRTRCSSWLGFINP